MRRTLDLVDLELALRLCAAARARAQADDALVSVAGVDGGRHLVAFQRMDGAEIAGPVLARDKAYTAVAHRVPTRRYNVQGFCSRVGANDSSGSPAPGSAVPSAMKSH